MQIGSKLGDVPREWVEERLAAVNPSLSQKALTASSEQIEELHAQINDIKESVHRIPVHLCFSYDPKRIDESDIELAVKDFSRGMAIQKCRGSDNIYFIVSGGNWKMWVNSHKYDVSRCVTTKLEYLSVPSGRLLVRPSYLSCAPIWEEERGDIAEAFGIYARKKQEVEGIKQGLWENAETLKIQLESDRKERRSKLNKADRYLKRSMVDPVIKQNDVLHAKLLKDYAAHRVMIKLLYERNRVGYRSARGKVRKSKKQTAELEFCNFTILLSPGTDASSFITTIKKQKEESSRIPRERRYPPIYLNNADESGAPSCRADVQKIGRDGTLSVVTDEFPWEDDADVVLTYAPRFGMMPHSQALQALFDHEAEGYWPNLVHLMTDPKRLQMPKIDPPKHFFCDSDPKSKPLNELQRKAVAGAMATPHAFCIQGPPGTGKTTVICEIVQQLLARGERVLLLAPQHVAVDGVLKKIGSKPSVKALRFCSKEKANDLDQAVMCYLPHQAIDKTLDVLRRREDSFQTEWQREIDDLLAAVDHLSVLSLSMQTLADAVKTKDKANQFFKDEEQREAGAAKKLREITECLEEARRCEEKCEQELDVAKNENSVAMLDAGVWEKILGSVGFGKVGRCRKRLKAGLNAFNLARDSRADLEMRCVKARQFHEQARSGVLVAKERLEISSAALIAAEEQRNACQASCGDFPCLNGILLESKKDAENVLTEFRAQVGRLQKYIMLEESFFKHMEKGTRAGREQLRNDMFAMTNLFCCTTTGVNGAKELKDICFDTLIVDEASRVTDSAFLIGAVKARRWIMVGDEKQLPPYVEQEDEYFIHALSALHLAETMKKDLSDAVNELGSLWKEDEELHQFRHNSVLEVASGISAAEQWKETFRSIYNDQASFLRSSVGNASRELLNTMRNHMVHSLFERVVLNCHPDMKVQFVQQRRMIAPIAEIVSGPVYGGCYDTPAESFLEPLTTTTFRHPIVFLDTSSLGRKAADSLENNSFINRIEAKRIVEACTILNKELKAENKTAVSVSILTFYKAQARLICNMLNQGRVLNKLKFSVIDSIDGIQGQESDVVFLSFCRTHYGKPTVAFGQWLQDLRRLNVACTRAKRALFFVGQKELLSKLCSVEEAMSFYANLNRLFDEHPDFQHMPQFGSLVREDTE